MKIVCNGDVHEIPPGTRVEDCLGLFGLDASSVVVECDGKILSRDQYGSHTLEDGSVLELIRFVGGG